MTRAVIAGPALGAALLASLVACTAPERATADARDAVRTDVDARLGAQPRDEPGVVAEARVRALLADGVTEDEAARIAILWHRGITARYAELGVPASALEAAHLWANPVLGVGVLFFGDGTEVDLSLSQSFVDVVLQPRRSAAARHALDAARARVAREVVGRAYAARRAHVAAVAVRARLDLATRHAAAQEASVELARRLSEAGNTTASTLALEEAALAERLLARSDAERRWIGAREALAREMGLHGEACAFEVAGDPPVDGGPAPDLAQVESRAIAASLDLAELRAHVAALAQEAGVAEIDARIRDLEVGIGAAKDRDGSDWGLGPHVGAGLPILDTGGTRAFGARARVAAAEAQAWSRAVAIRSLARTLRDRVRSLESDARFARDVLVPAEERVVEETLRNYNAMQVGAFDVLRAQGQLLAAERRQIDLAAEAAAARLDLLELFAGRANDARLAFDGLAATAEMQRAPQGGH